MISVNEAIRQIRLHTSLLPPLAMPLNQATGLSLAEDVYAQVSVPAFHQSAMDGYALRHADYHHSKEFTVNGEVAAGDAAEVPALPQSVVRIFTGAAVPEGFDTVVMQEKTTLLKNKLLVQDGLLEKGSNVRRKGSEIEEGNLALSRGAVLTPAAIGFLAGVGTTTVIVQPKPRVRIIVTGNELQQPGKPLQAGQVYESNSVMLQSALQQLHVTEVTVVYAVDDRNKLQESISAALEKADLVLLTGGVSVGKYDFVVQAAQDCNVQVIFHKVAQRPGKPLFCGHKENKMVFGLPGNPASVLSCFYNYVVVALEKMTGITSLLERKKLPLLQSFSKKIALTQFLKAVWNEDGVNPLPAQESFRLSSFSVANCLIVLPEEKKDYKEGDTVEILCLPYL